MTTLTKEQLQSVEEVFIRLVTEDTDWSHAADKFVGWCLAHNFKNQSFKNFVEWIYVDDEYKDAELNPKVWDFFFGYGNDYKKFADDWVADEERNDYLKYCEK